YEEIELDLDIHGYIPRDYIEEAEKIVIYRRLIAIETIEELQLMKDEIKDRFGKLPKPVEDLFEYLTIKILAQKNNVKSIKAEEKTFKIKFVEGKIKIEKIQELIISKKIKYLQREGAIEVSDIKSFFIDYK
ncbi:MAG: transcription-repair coupling factor, partial [Fusobacteria bacterium]